MLTVALIFGGRSAEHEVSLVSARCLLSALDPEKYRVVAVGITPEGRWVQPRDVGRALIHGLEAVESRPVALLADPTRGGLQVAENDETVPIDVAVPVLHGPFGEDGTIQGLFELAGLPYTGAGVAASAVGMDKEMMKGLFAQAGLPQVEYEVAREGGDVAALARHLESRFAYPVFVKPVNLGSSVGIAKAHDRGELEAGLAAAFGFDRKVIVEAFVEARELECGVLGNERPEVSVAGEVVPANEFYDYQSKYTDGMMSFTIPAELTDEQAAEVRRLAAAAFTAIDCAGYARCDFFLERSSGRILVNEINTIPGLTDVSAFPKVWAASGVPYRELADRIVTLALERHAKRSALRTSRG